MKFSKIKEMQASGFYIKRRTILAIMCSLGLMNMYATRNNINIAIVAMVNATTSYAKSPNVSEVCPDRSLQQHREIASMINGIFSWNSAQQGLIMGSYFYGYIFSNIPGAWLSRRYGFKLVLGISLFISSFLTILVPFVAYKSFKLLVALRILLGFIQGVTFPTVMGVWSKWSPPLERSILTGISTSGSTLGTVFIYSVGGTIASKWGWEAIFYLTGALGFPWSVVWFLIIHDDPEKHPRISKQEKTFITDSIKAEIGNGEDDEKIPWKEIIISKPVWAVIISSIANSFGAYGLTTMLPTYMATVLNFNLTASGILVALPYVLKWITIIVSGYVTDLVRAKGWISTIAVRKLNESITSFGTAICVLLACYVGCDVTAAVVFFFLAIGLIGFSIPGNETNSIDIAPKYAGIVYSIRNTFGNCSGFISPQIAGLILLGGNNPTQWKIVFWTTASVLFLGGILYLALASANVQKWAQGNKEDISESALLEIKS